MIRLPLLVRRPRNLLAYLVLWLPYIAIYELTNHFPVFVPQELPMTWVDHAIPFMPSLLPLYVAYIPFYWWTAARMESDEALNRFFYATHFQLLVCATVYVLFPVRMPRELFYPPEAMGLADAFWRWFDAPNNCLPSLHVANCLLFAQVNWNKRFHRSCVALALAIAASTVLVKQHYVVDVIAGAIVYLATALALARVEVVSVSPAVARWIGEQPASWQGGAREEPLR